MEVVPRATYPFSPEFPIIQICYPAKSAVPLPLSFGRVNDGRPVTSQTMLFRLPIELVHEVITYLDTTDLRSLALADRDCRQLARSRLFASVVLDYSDAKRALLDMLSLHEARSRRDNGGVTENPSIGACIRRVTVVKQSTEVRNRQRRYPADDCLGYQDRWADETIFSPCGSYFLDIAKALRFSLPNLDEFIWEDSASLPRYMLMAIASSPIRHLGLHYVRLSPDREYQFPLLEQQKWALRSLDVKVGPHTGSWELSKLCTSILEAAAPTLEKLTWRDYEEAEMSLGGSIIRFPRLRTLLIDTIRMPEGRVLESFFPSGARNCVLRSVSIKVQSSHEGGFLAQRGRIQGLESLSLHATSQSDSTTVDATFLSANPHLKSLTLCGYKPEQLTPRLLPLLASNFKFLTTLILYFAPSMISNRDLPLTAIGLLPSLTSLWIVARPTYPWTVDVQQTITALSPLRNLTRLALAREISPLASIEQKAPGHKRRMRKIVELYAKMFGRLRWVYFEFLVHRVVENAVVTEEEFRYYSPEGVWESPDWC